MESLRPRGTVEVTCSAPGCRWSFWLDPVDSRIPDGPFDCGADHAITSAMDECRLAMWRDHGIAWASWAVVPGGACHVVGPCGRGGEYRWARPEDMRDVASAVASIAWNDSRPYGEHTAEFVRKLRASMDEASP